MFNDNLISSRKQDHITINLNKDVQSRASSGLDTISFVHNALPEMNYDQIDTRAYFLGQKMNMPLIISSMTGGVQESEIINRNLAIAAQELGIAMALGSMRPLLHNTESLASYDMRKIAPNIILLANIGAIQLNYGVTIEDCQRLIDLIGADGLILHLNPLQELTQKEGDKNWLGLLDKIHSLTQKISVPIIIKEVGYGISTQLAQRLIERGVTIIDTAGAGGTSWSEVEAHRAGSTKQERIARSFIKWGIPTATSIEMVRSVLPETTGTIIASGGITSGIHGAKAIRLGADLFAIARPLLKPATLGTQEVIDELEIIKAQLKIVMHCTGSSNLKELRSAAIF